MYKALSLGAGVQSSTLALLAEHGEIERPDFAIFSDTQDEPQVVYAWLDWLEKHLSYPVYRVSRGRLWDSATRIRISQKSGRPYIQTAIPIYFATPDGAGLAVRRGIGKRHCTRDFKTNVILSKTRELVGITGKTVTEPVVSMMIGISEDEDHRAKPSPRPWVQNRYPLLALGMDRQDCIEWMADKGYPQPPRSACKYCPFHDDDTWTTLTPEEMEEVGAMELQLQRVYKEAGVFDGVPYFHDSLVPITQVQFKLPEQRPRQRKLFAADCEGMCGI